MGPVEQRTPDRVRVNDRVLAAYDERRRVDGLERHLEPSCVDLGFTEPLLEA